MNIKNLFLLLLSLVIYTSLNAQKPLLATSSQNTTPEIAEDLNFQKMIQPAPLQAKFSEDGYYVWGSTLVKGKDNLYHLYYSRWPQALGHNAWVTSSEVAHAVGESPTGPFVFKDIALSARGEEYWDGLVTHNPTIHFFEGKYYLYYMGNTGNGKANHEGLYWIHRNNQRIGVVIADDPNGPWKRFNIPLIDVSSDSLAHDALMVSNPSVTEMPDGRFLMVYKAVAKKNKMPFGGPVVHLTAIANQPTGPFVKQNKPIFTAENSVFPAEDPYIWYDNGTYYAIVKDMHGAFTKHGKSLVLFNSKDGFDWKPAKYRLVSTLQVIWENGQIQQVAYLERPQLFFQNGKPTVLLLACDITRAGSFNVQIPLK
jgi:hypothetical protein